MATVGQSFWCKLKKLLQLSVCGSFGGCAGSIQSGKSPAPIYGVLL